MYIVFYLKLRFQRTFFHNSYFLQQNCLDIILFCGHIYLIFQVHQPIGHVEFPSLSTPPLFSKKRRNVRMHCGVCPSWMENEVIEYWQYGESRMMAAWNFTGTAHFLHLAAAQELNRWLRVVVNCVTTSAIRNPAVRPYNNGI